MNYFFDPILKRYFDFKGLATRKEYWLFFFFIVLFNIVFSIIDAATGMIDIESGVGVFSTIFTLLIFIPSLAIAARRLHDVGFSAWWLLFLIVPFGFLVLFILMVLPSKREGNKYRQTLEVSAEAPAVEIGGSVHPEKYNERP